MCDQKNMLHITNFIVIKVLLFGQLWVNFTKVLIWSEKNVYSLTVESISESCCSIFGESFINF